MNNKEYPFKWSSEYFLETRVVASQVSQTKTEKDRFGNFTDMEQEQVKFPRHREKIDKNFDN